MKTKKRGCAAVHPRFLSNQSDLSNSLTCPTSLRKPYNSLTPNSMMQVLPDCSPSYL